MKKVLSILMLTLVVIASAQEYKVITVVESLVPVGLGRSRLIENKTALDIKDLTTERTDGKKTNMGKVERQAAKVDSFEESKLLNFYSATGINFQNIASNDALISSKLNQLTTKGWKLVFVTSGVESDAGLKDNRGIFITRFIFQKE